MAKESKRKHGKKKSSGETPTGGDPKEGTHGGVSIEKVESAAVEEDLRRSEDSVVVINRQAEQEEDEQVCVWSVSVFVGGCVCVCVFVGWERDED